LINNDHRKEINRQDAKNAKVLSLQKPFLATLAPWRFKIHYLRNPEKPGFRAGFGT